MYEGWETQEAFAGNDALEKFPVAVVLQLADNEETEIRERLAKNPGITTFADVLEKLAVDDDWSVRRSLAGHPGVENFPVSVLEKLAVEGNASVRRSFALPRLQPQADQSTIQ